MPDIFLSTHGYGSYIWSAYGLTLVALGGLCVVSVRRLKAARARLATLEKERGSSSP